MEEKKPQEKKSSPRGYGKSAYGTVPKKPEQKTSSPFRQKKIFSNKKD